MTLVVIKEHHSVENWNTLAVLEDLGRKLTLGIMGEFQMMKII